MGPDMAAATTMNDPLPTSVPRLDPTGSNWAIFSMRFQEAMEATRSGATLMAPSLVLLRLMLASYLPVHAVPETP